MDFSRRYLVNPTKKVVIAIPKTKLMIDLYKRITESSHYEIPIGEAEHVLGPLSDAETATTLRGAPVAARPADALAARAPLQVSPALKVCALR
jgi:hypothetical protein